MLKIIILAALGALAGCSGSSECKQDVDCPAGRYCQAGDCTYDCSLDEQCPSGYRCTPRGQCERGCIKSNDGIEACDGVDNDCDDLTDEDFVELGLPCDFGCAAGRYVCSPDGAAALCDAPRPADDDATCNGLDDDCDDLTDEDAAEQACPLQAGVCQGATTICQDGAYTACDYGPNYDPVDDSCDGLDNDCDGTSDNDAALLPIPELGAYATDGLDNNCNGIVDEPGGLMVRVSASLAVDVYEAALFENPDCSGTQFGVGGDDYPNGFPAQGNFSTTLYACSLPDIYPSGYLSWFRAGQACMAQGKRLCTASEFRSACAGPNQYAFPYGQYWAPGTCNDGWLGDRFLAKSGEFAACRSEWGLYDMSGNLAEWVLEQGNLGAGTRLTGGGSYACLYCQGGMYCRLCDHAYDEFEFDKMNNCFPDAGQDREYECFYDYMAYDYLGGRCCMDLP